MSNTKEIRSAHALPGITRPAAIGLRRRSTVAIFVVSVAGLLAFGWPLLIAPGSDLLGQSQAPLVLALLLPLLIAVVLAEISDGGLDVKAIALLGVLSAVGSALRPLGAGTAGLETVFFLLILGGRVFGPGFGFVLGATTMFGSALITGGVGPWLPFQMIAAAWVGLGAGLLPRLPRRGRRAEIALLAAYGAVAGLAYGVMMNFSFWPFALGDGTALSFVAGDPISANLHRFALYSIGTSLGWDIGRVLTNVVLIVLTGPAILAVLRRAARRASFAEAPRFVDAAHHPETPAATAPSRATMRP